MGSFDVTAMCLEVYGLTIFSNLSLCKLNKIVEATMPVNPYDDRKVSLGRTHRNGDLDIVRASYTRCKANVTEALVKSAYQKYFSYFSTKTYVVGTQKNRLNETILLSTHNIICCGYSKELSQ